MNDNQSCSVRLADGIAGITLCQPDRGNPFDLTFNTDISSIAEIHENPDVRCVALDAQGKYFRVGANLKALTADRLEHPALVTKSAARVTGVGHEVSSRGRIAAEIQQAFHDAQAKKVRA